MSYERLFENHSDPMKLETPEASGQHTSPLAEYVLTKMPVHLGMVERKEMTYEELAAQHEVLLEEVRPDIEANLDPAVAKVTQMDLLFLFGGYIPTGEQMYQAAPSTLLPLIQHHAHRFDSLETFMSYAMIIDVNSQEYRRTGNIRVYSEGETGEHERDFYIGHSLSEPHVRQAAYSLKQFVENPDLYNPLEVFNEALTNLDTFDSYMGRYGRLPRDAFESFRKYLAEYADKTRNASGAFMPSVQLLELVLHAPSPMQDTFVQESMPYFPGWAQPVIQQWRSDSISGENIADLIDQEIITLNTDSKASLLRVIDEFISFRMKHLAITRVQIPGAFSELDPKTRQHIKYDLEEKEIRMTHHAENSGTAGFNVPNILVNSVRRLMGLSDRIAEIAV